MFRDREYTSKVPNCVSPAFFNDYYFRYRRCKAVKLNIGVKCKPMGFVISVLQCLLVLSKCIFYICSCFLPFYIFITMLD